jgi:hypothetical protein
MSPVAPLRARVAGWYRLPSRLEKQTILHLQSSLLGTARAQSTEFSIEIRLIPRSTSMT